MGCWYFQAVGTMKVLMANKNSSEFKGHHAENGWWYRRETWHRSAGKHCTLCKIQSPVPGTSDEYLWCQTSVGAYESTSRNWPSKRKLQKREDFFSWNCSPLCSIWAERLRLCFALRHDWTPCDPAVQSSINLGTVITTSVIIFLCGGYGDN